MSMGGFGKETLIKVIWRYHESPYATFASHLPHLQPLPCCITLPCCLTSCWLLVGLLVLRYTFHMWSLEFHGYCQWIDDVPWQGSWFSVLACPVLVFISKHGKRQQISQWAVCRMCQKPPPNKQVLMDKIRETSCGERIDRHPKWLTGLSASGMLRFRFLALPVYNMFLVHTVRRVFSKLDVYGKIAQITYTHIQLYNHCMQIYLLLLVTDST